MPVILIAIADCKRRKSAITCVCFRSGNFLSNSIVSLSLYENFQLFSLLESICLISPEGDDGRNGVSQLFF